MPSVEIPIPDEFTEEAGKFTNYDAIPLNQRDQLHKQKHVDIRLFNDEPVSSGISMLYLDALTLFELDQLKMNQLSIDDGAQIVIHAGENWTAGTVARQSDRNYWHGISLSCTVTGPNITQSVMT